MYKFTIYRRKKGSDYSKADRIVQQLTCERETIASLVERLNVQHSDYEYYFMRDSDFISRLDYCKEEIKRTHEQVPPIAERENEVYITAWLNGGCITWNEAEELRAYNVALARDRAEKGEREHENYS